jgi:organic radical activating enzyme
MPGNGGEYNESLIFRQKLNSLSPSFCGAKWYEGTIWLHSGLTASCHHTPTHPISREALKTSPSALHNTDHKLAMRRLMQKGIRPEECDYCWKLEDMGPETVSDRVHKSQRVSLKSLVEAKELPWKQNVAPQFLEIAFDRICQFACMYCSPSFSTTWERDIALNGKYNHLETDHEEHYISSHESVRLQDKGADYVEAFWRWWPELVQSLKTLRVTGGEPLLSPHVWSLIGREDIRKYKLQLAFNSNLGIENQKIKEFLKALDGCVPVEIYTSGESFGEYGEYIRDGKNWETWVSNLETTLASETVKSVCVSFTINAMAVVGMVPLLDMIMVLKKKYGHKRLKFFWNLVRFPRFQSLVVLPLNIRRSVGEEITLWLKQNYSDLQDFERETIERFLQYLSLEIAPTEQVDSVFKLQKDLKKFLVQYDERRGKSYKNTFKGPLADWLESI